MSRATDTSTPERSLAAARPPETTGLSRATVAVLMGGRSSERAISLVSGRAVTEALSTPADEADRRGPARVIPVDLRQDGRWSFGGRDRAPGEAIAALDEVDVFFLALHGGEGEGGCLQGFLRATGKAFTGSDVGASALCLDKAVALRLVEAHGLCTPRGVHVPPWEWAERGPALVAELAAWDVPGWVVKPRRGGSSVGTTLHREAGELPAAIEAVLAAGDDALVEAELEGVEATCAVLGNPERGARSLTPIEIRPHPGRFFDYEEKYSDAGAAELCPPERLDRAACERLRELALRAHRALGCAGYSRSDFIVPSVAPGSGEPVYLETNTLPGLTPRSLFPQAAAHDGIDFRSLCLEILRLGLEARRTPR